MGYWGSMIFCVLAFSRFSFSGVKAFLWNFCEGGDLDPRGRKSFSSMLHISTNWKDISLLKMFHPPKDRN